MLEYKAHCVAPANKKFHPLGASEGAQYDHQSGDIRGCGNPSINDPIACKHIKSVWIVCLAEQPMLLINAFSVSLI